MQRIGIIHYLKIGLPVAVLVGAAVLSLLGYGAAAAIGDMFGMPRELVYDTPLDLLHLSSYAVIGMVERLASLWEYPAFLQLVYMCAVLGGILTALLLLLRLPVVRKGAKNAYGGLRSGMSACPGRRILLSYWQWLSKEKLCFIPLVYFSALPFVVVLGMAGIAILFVIIPLVGNGAAQAHLHNWVVSAEYCVPLSNRNGRLKQSGNESRKTEDSSVSKKMTPCLFLLKDGVVVAKGRHVVSTNSHIVLFDPDSGEVTLKPIDGMSVRTGSK